METIRRIMLAVDFSDYSLMSLRYAASLAKDAGAELLLVNVVNHRDVEIMKKVADQYPSFSMESRLEAMVEDRKNLFRELLAQVNTDGIVVEILIRSGVPHLELLQVIGEKRPDLLVMATKGRSNLLDTLVGSCARKMFRQSPIPVLSLRGKK